MMIGSTPTMLVGWLFGAAGTVSCLVLPRGIMTATVSTILVAVGAVMIMSWMNADHYVLEDGGLVP